MMWFWAPCKDHEKPVFPWYLKFGPLHCQIGQYQLRGRTATTYHGEGFLGIDLAETVLDRPLFFGFVDLTRESSTGESVVFMVVVLKKDLHILPSFISSKGQWHLALTRWPDYLSTMTIQRLPLPR